jgi:hypothetical protein
MNKNGLKSSIPRKKEQNFNEIISTPCNNQQDKNINNLPNYANSTISRQLKVQSATEIYSYTQHYNKKNRVGSNSSLKKNNENLNKSKSKEILGLTNISSSGQNFNLTLGSKFHPLTNINNFRSSSPNLSNSSPNKEKLQLNINQNSPDRSLKEFEENEKKLKETISMYSNTVRRNEGSGVNTLFKVRTILLNWLKDSEQDNLEYSKFMTEKKIKYLLKNKDKLECKTKVLESELTNMKLRKAELQNLISEIYISYETEELEQEIERFSNSYEIRLGKSSKMLEKFEEMKRTLPLLKEFNSLKDQEVSKTKEKNENEKIVKSSLQTLGFLSNYYKNLRKKINELSNNIVPFSK